MKKIVLAILLLFSASAWAGGEPNPADYTVNVHVRSSSIAVGGRQDLNVVIDGKNYELLCECAPGTLLALGDYKAKLVKDEHKNGYDSLQVYEFLFPDKKTRQFELIGQSE
ncbi:MAG: hypothetical protein ABSA27_14085 [Terriglobales bacterium]|jgi:hypothetical protein